MPLDEMVVKNFIYLILVPVQYHNYYRNRKDPVMTKTFWEYQPRHAQKHQAQTGINRRTLLHTGICAMALGMAGAAHAAQNTFRAGAGHEDITIALPSDGFAVQHDPLTARVVLFDDGANKVALASIDLTSIGAPLAARWATLIAKHTGWPQSNILICAGHSFSTPHVFVPDETHPGLDVEANATLLAAIETAITAAANRARQRLAPVRMGYNHGISHLAVNRDVPTPAGWWIGANEDGYSDPTLSVMRFDDPTGKPVIVLVNYAVQPAVLNGVTNAMGQRVISADLTGAVTRRIEAQYGPDTTAFFLPGAGGDQAPYLQGSQTELSADGKFTQTTLGEKSFVLLDLLGDRLAGNALHICDAIKPNTIRTLMLDRGSVTLTGLERSRPQGPTLNWNYKTTGPVDLPYSILQIGKAVIVTTAPELSAALGTRIRQNAPFDMTMVVTMVGDAAKYLPDQQGYDHISYEAISTPYAPGSGEIFADAVVKHLRVRS